MIDKRIQEAIRHNAVGTVYGPRIQPDVTHKMLHYLVHHADHGDVHRGDVVDTELYYGLGNWYRMFATGHWMDTLTTRQFLELLCAFQPLSNPAFEPKPLDMPADKIIDLMMGEMSYLRHVNTDKLHYAFERNGLFIDDHQEYWKQTMELVYRSRVFMPILYMILCEAWTDKRIESMRGLGEPWFTRLPGNTKTWADGFDITPIKNILSIEAEREEEARADQWTKL